MSLRQAPPLLLALALALAACTTPVYVDQGKQEEAPPLALNAVAFNLHEAWTAKPPACIAILPLKGPEKGDAPDKERIEAVRLALYAHLAPQGRRDVKPARVDFILDHMPAEQQGDMAAVGRALNCEALLTGRVTESGMQYLGIYSRVGVGAELKVVRAADGTVLWDGTHVATLHGGGVPISPVGIAMGIFDAARNVDDEQILRATDDLARRLISTMPDPGIVALEDPAEPQVKAQPVTPQPPKQGLAAFLDDTAKLPADERRIRLIQALDQGRFGEMAKPGLLDALVATEGAKPEDYVRYADYLASAGDYNSALARAQQAVARDDAYAPGHFMAGRMQIKLGDAETGEKEMIRAVALDNGNADFLNGLGYVNGLRGRSERALAAYDMAIKANPANGFAYYNTGVILLGQGDRSGAADAFYGAALSYIKSKQYGQAGKALADLRELSGAGIDLGQEIQTIEGALAALDQKKG